MAAHRLKYNPSHMPEDELLRSFVVRQRDLAAILETVRENTGASNQHLLILGPRGMGKTTLVNRAVAEIHRTPELNRLWYPILFDEESYTVTSAGELWFQALSHLADQTKDPELYKARRALQTVTDRTRLRDASLARLLEFADAQHKRLLLAVENIDMIFDDQMVDDDGWDVRHTLQNEPRIMVLATSTTRLDSFHDSQKPLYELFREHTLERLDLEECRTVWHLVTGTELPLNQARPIQIFTGGNTRLLTILATFARGRSFRELMDDLVGLIDENTPYFKHNIESLPSESRKIFVTLADIWSPATSRQIAEQTRGDIRAVSAQLGRLERQGVVEVVRRVDKTQMFQVTERMYNLYHLLRRRGSARVRAVVEFMVSYYDHDSLQRMLDSLAAEASNPGLSSKEDLAHAYCELLKRLPSPELRREVLSRAPAPFVEHPDIARLLNTVTPVSPQDPPDESVLRARLRENAEDVDSLVLLAGCLQTRGESKEALAVAEHAMALAPDSTAAVNVYHQPLLTLPPDQQIDNLRRAHARAQGAAGLLVQLILAHLLAQMDATEEARALANDLLESQPDDAELVNATGVVFIALREPQHAREAFAYALELAPTDPRAALNLSRLSIEMGQLAEAETQLRRFLTLRPHVVKVWIALADLLEQKRSDPEGALFELTRGSHWLPNDAVLLSAIARLQVRLGHFLEATTSLLNLSRATTDVTDPAAARSIAHITLIMLSHLAQRPEVVLDWILVLDTLTMPLADASLVRQTLPDILGLIIHAAAHGYAAKALQVLDDSPSTEHLEPLIIALRRFLGQPTNPPQEVSEVADDIGRDIVRIRNTCTTASPSHAPTTEHRHLRQSRRRKRTRPSH